MQIKWYQSIRVKLFGTFLVSLVSAALGLALLMGLAHVVSTRFHELNRLMVWVVNLFGAVPLMVFTGLFVFGLSYYLMTMGTIRFIEELDQAIDQVARGNFDARVGSKREDELGRVAENLARMTVQLKAAMEEERKTQRSRQDLIASVSHDLRTPLTAILGYLQLIDEDRYRDEVELRHYVGIAYEKSRQLRRMIDQLFEFTRTSHGSLRFKPVMVNLGEMLEQLAEEFVPSLQTAGMRYRLAIPPERIDARIDPDLLVRVFENLMSNAIRYGHAGTQVDLELLRVGNQAVVRVANYGEPIPDYELPRLFDLFYRVEKSRSARTGGAGLGLAIARNIVDLHGGKISAYSDTGRTVFEVCLPAVAIQPASVRAS